MPIKQLWMLIALAGCESKPTATAASRAPVVTSEPTSEIPMPSRKDAPAAPVAPPIEVTARQLFADYQANEVRADGKYRGKPLRVSGRITQIGKDVLDDPFVTFATPSEFDSVHASFGDSAPLASLVRGQRIAVRCRGMGMSLGSPLLSGCMIDLETPADSAAFIPNPGAAVKVTLDLAGKEVSADEQRAMAQAAIAVRNHCSSEDLRFDPVGDLWHTAALSVRRNGRTFIVQAGFDDRRKSVHKGRTPKIEVDTKLTRIHALNEDARVLCKL